MLELSTLVFKVDDTQLKQAHDLIASLGPAMQGVANASGKVDKATQQAGRATEALGKGAEKASKQLKGQTDLLTKLDLLYEDLADGSTRWEATTLRSAREMGIPLNEVKKRLEDIRKLTKDPFDSAIGSVRSITQNFTELQNRIELTNQGLIFTTKQLREFSRIPFEVEGRRKAQGKDTESGFGRLALVEEIAKEQRAYAAKAVQVNELATAEKKRMEVTKQAIQAEKFLATEMQRVDAVMAEMNNQFGLNAATGERSAAAVAKYANALERAGITGVESAARLETYRNKVQQIAMQDEKRASARLARALTPQISDVAVSIAGGMPLHLVIMQQGLQIRDLIDQSGVSAKTLQETFKTSASQMVSSIGGTIAALGALTFGALVDAGKAVANFGVNATGLGENMRYLNTQLVAAAANGDNTAKALLRLGSVVTTAVGLAIGATVIALGAMVVASVKVIKEQGEVSKALNTTSASLGMTTGAAYDYVSSIDAVSGKTQVALNALVEMGKAGAFPAQAMKEIVSSAVQMEKAAGVAVSETVKNFAKLRDEPLKAVLELGKQTGYFSQEVIENIRQLEQQGRTFEAGNLAMREYAKGTKASAEAIINNYGTLERVAKGITTAFGNMWDAVLGIGRPTGDIKILEENATRLRNLANQDSGNLFAEQQAELAESALRAARALEQQAKAKATNAANSELLADMEQVRNSSLTASQKYQQETNKLIALESNLRDKNLLTEKDALAIQNQKDKLYKGYLESLRDKGAEKAAASAVAYEKSAVEKLNDAYNQSIGKVQELTRVEKALSDIRDDPKYKQGSETYRKGIDDYAKKLIEQEKAELDAMEAEKEANKVREKSVELRNKQVEAANKLILATQQSIRGLDSQIADVDFNSSVFGMSPELERKLRSEYELKKKYEQAGLDFYKEVEVAKETTSAGVLQEQLEMLGVKYQRSIELAQKQAELENKTLTDQQKRIQGFDAVFKQGFDSMSDKLIEFAATGEASFSDMIKSMLMELAKLELKMQMMKMYESMGGGSESGILGTLAGLFTGTVQAKGGAWDNGVQMFAKGGVVNRTTAFGMQGGLGVVGEAGPEAIMPLKRGRDGSLGVSGGSGTNVQVIINNHSQAQVQQKETVDSRGNRRVEVTVGDMTAGEIQRNGSSAQRSIGSTFGMQPVLKNR